MTRLGFFTRLLDDAPAAERYRLALEQIRTAERLGFASAWVAQHHFHGAEGGLPSPFVLLAHAAATTSRIRLGTGVVTLPLENAVRVAEDAVVLDELSGGRVELGVGSGSTPATFLGFGVDPADRQRVFAERLAELDDALRGRALGHDENRLYPSAAEAGLPERVWRATFSADGARFAGEAGQGLMLSRTQPGPSAPAAVRGAAIGAHLAGIQEPVVDAYLEALPAGVAPRVLASRTVFVADTRAEARALAETGLRSGAPKLAALGNRFASDDLDDLIAGTHTHVGTAEEVAESLSGDRVALAATDLAVQVHSVDAPHDRILRSLELIATEVAPALGLELSLVTAAR